ncbi:hypothetical protein QAD02_016026 [Eretmocerus hayati]|uniref:Uncharacterized protein n=1 Tax=Eretmocerus hayati TaxID=131215 RepID=A0ACC2PCB8_9HYME|nr:hypothetical protein QAD02_016026 [Eretmocerus hayati]
MELENKILKNLCQPGFIYLETPNRFLSMYRRVHEKCQLMKISESYWASMISFMHYGGSRYRSTLDKYLVRFRSAGILKYLRRQWLNQDWPKTQFYTLQKVELGHIQNLFISYIVAAAISCVVCIFENIWFKFVQKRFKQSNMGKKENYHDLIILSWRNNQNLIDFVALPTNLKNVLNSRDHRSK